ncbi:hypothetical protein VV867_13855 [Pseudomonas sp. JH-2]|uniref:hypothetical protein n=1 Tax=Pseudomonas sp. JH-2 TaxID=3114998 RepID=UPI002E25C711|nr:hypothetical protein [Pseudomonas sp. JH-2]
MTPHRWFPSRRHDGVAELQALVDELGGLLEGSHDLAAKDIPAFKARLRHLTDDCHAIGDRLAYQGRRALRRGGDYASEHPWQVALILAATCGALVAACLINRRR